MNPAPKGSKADNWVRGVLMAGFILVFGILVWQLWGLNPKSYCATIMEEAGRGVGRGQLAHYYVGCVIKLLDTKTIVLGGCLGIIGVFVIAHVIRDTKVFASINAPGGFGGRFGTDADAASPEAPPVNSREGQE